MIAPETFCIKTPGMSKLAVHISDQKGQNKEAVVFGGQRLTLPDRERRPVGA